MVIEVSFRIAALFSMQLMARDWYRPFLFLWIDGGAMARMVTGVATIFILFASTPKHAFRSRSLVWVAAPLALAFSFAEVLWLVGFHFQRFSGIENVALSILTYASVGGVVCWALVWMRLRSIVHRDKHPWLLRLCELGFVANMVGLVVPVLYDLPVSLDLEPFIAFEITQALGPKAFGGCGLREAIAIVELCVLWLFVRALNDNNQGDNHLFLGSGISHKAGLERTDTPLQS